MGRTVEKLVNRKFPGCSPKMNFEKVLELLCVAACRAELIGILFVELANWLKSYFGGLFYYKSAFAPLA
jgi:hypothetical protein